MARLSDVRGQRWRFPSSVSLGLASAIRLHNGRLIAKRDGRRPESSESMPTPRLELFEYEASPYCRLVRETLCVLGLRALIRPCPRETLRFEGAFSPASPHRAEAQARGARLSFPFLHDHSAGVALNESRAICDHLWRTYGAHVERPWQDEMLNGGSLPRLLEFALLAAPSGLRPLPSHGLLAAPSRQPERPLVLYGCEPDPGSRAVREALCSLQIAYELVPTYESSPHAPSVPHLDDPNTGVQASGARPISKYLDETYREGPSLDYLAGMPEPNLGDPNRTSWLTKALAWLPVSAGSGKHPRR